VTTPTENNFETDVIRPHDRTRPITLTNEIAVDRLVSLLNEFVAQGALPAL
jgi:hypothetical protein